MKKRHLEMALSDLSDLSDLQDPDPTLEQYATPADIVSWILWQALENGDIIDRTVLELGCGGAPFALGALMMGASKATGVDVDPRCIGLAEKNLGKVVVSGLLENSELLLLLEGDILEKGPEIPHADTVFMNPPFGAQMRHADRDFIRTACEKGSVVYAIHNGGTEKFVRSEYERMGARAIELVNGKMSIPHLFHFHRREKVSIDVIFTRVSMV